MYRLLSLQLNLFMIQMPIKKDILSFGFLSLTLLICGVSAVIGMLFIITGIWNDNTFVTATSITGVEMLPDILDEGIDATVVVEGLERPTSMAFLGPNDFIVLEKKSGIVKRIVNGNILEPPLLDLKVANEKERGLLGVAISKMVTQTVGNSQSDNKEPSNPHSTRVFLYYTESSGEDGIDDCPTINYCAEGTEPKGNRLYRYDLEQDRLVNPKLLLDLPANPGADHLGGSLIIGPDSNLYLTTGDGHSCSYNSCDEGIEETVLNSQSANVDDGHAPDGRGGILRVTQDGEQVTEGDKRWVLGDVGILGKYYAYGIRNSYGIDFDHLSGKLWDTENGPSFGDEINLVEPGFNSGWLKIQGIWPIYNHTLLYPQGLTPPYRGYFESGDNKFISSSKVDLEDLVDFQGRGKYSDPEFIWNMTVGLTALKFFDSDKLGEEYKDDLFVADSNNGNLYHFDLSVNRTTLEFGNSITDRIVRSLDKGELGPILFGHGFDSITDLELGPDGYLYVVSHKQGKIFKIVPDDVKESPT